jgi:hypothetical protein
MGGRPLCRTDREPFSSENPMHAQLGIDRPGWNPMTRREGSLRVINLKVSEKPGERKSRFSRMG